MNFYKCDLCDNLIGVIENNGGPLDCCNNPMKELIPNRVDASHEKHLPAVTVTGDCISVQIGSVAHPMEEAHHIVFVYLQTKKGGQRKSLCIGDDPKVSFAIVDDQPLAAYAYCNLHGLWITEI